MHLATPLAGGRPGFEDDQPEVYDSVFAVLVAPSSAIWLVSSHSQTSALINDLRSMLSHVHGADADFVADALQTLREAEEAGQVRNRAVHDWWVRVPDVDGNLKESWSGLRRRRGDLTGLSPTDPPRDLAFMEDALAKIHRAILRAFGLQFFLTTIVEFHQPSVFEGQKEYHRALVAGAFDLAPDGSVVMRDPTVTAPS